MSTPESGNDPQLMRRARRLDASSVRGGNDSSLSVERLEALFALLGSLKRHDVIAIDKLAERLGVDSAALRRDLKSLQYVGVPPFGGGDLLPLELDEDGYLEVTGELPALDRPLRLSFEQALALVLALEIAGFAPDDALVSKLSHATDDDAHHLDVFELARMLRVTPADPAPAIFEAVTQALTEGRSLTVKYRRSDGTQTARVIEPYLLFVEGDQWYVTAFCHLRGRVQNFRLNRIESAELVDRITPGEILSPGESNIPGDKVPDPLLPLSPHALDTAGLPLAHLRFADAATFIARDWPGAQIKSQHGSVMEVDVPYTAGSGTWFARHVAAAAGKIEVLFPEEARDLVREYTQRQLKSDRDLP